MKTKICHALMGVGFSVFASTVLALESPSSEERFKKIEDQLTTLRDENQQLRQQLGVESKSPAAFARAAGKEQRFAVGGYLQSQVEFGSAPDNRFAGINDRFLIRRARLNVAGRFVEQFDFKLEGDFGNNSIAGKTGYSAQLTDGFINWNRYDFANIKFGQFKTPFGYEQLLADTKTLTAERSLVNDRLTLSRQIGLGVSGNFFTNRLGYSVGMFNGNNINNGANDDDHFQYVGRLTGVPIQTRWAGQDVKLSLGFNGYYSKDTSVSGLSSADQRFDSTATAGVNDLFAGRRAGWGVDTQFKWGRFDMLAEILGAHFDPVSGNNTVATTDDSFDALGFSVLGGFYVCPKVQAIVRYETLNMNRNLSGNSTEEWTFGVNYYIKGDDIKLQFNYLFGSPLGGLDNQGRFIARAQIIF